MDALIENFGVIAEGFRTTLAMTALAAVASFLLGMVLAAMRVSPVPALRAAGAFYVNTARNTPLTVMFVLVVFGLPEVGVRISFFTRAVLALTLYTAAFFCEALRSGVNAIQAGQAEAARAIGMTFFQSLTVIVLPQAVRTVIPPLGTIVIALTKNSAIASVFGVTEAANTLENLARDFPGALYWLFFGIAMGYVLIVLAIAGVTRFVEQKVVVLR